MDSHRPFDPKPPSSCGECSLLAECGGLEGEAFSVGCFQRCTAQCQFGWCDMVCPCLHLNFAELIEEVGGLCHPPQRELIPCALNDLPFYVPHVEHGSRRSEALAERVVSVPLTALVGMNRGGRYVVRYDTPEAMRDGLRISRDTAVVVSSVAPDRYIEDFWAWHERNDTLAHLASLRLCAMTVPNYSFMTDVPRPNSLYNLTRIFRVAERISASGIPTVLHLQASNRRDWSRWGSVLRDQPQSRHVALEFQTGARRRETGDKYFFGLVELQNELSRPLHPIVMAGGFRIRDFAGHFDAFTIADSTPFIKTMKRKILLHSTNGGWRSYPTEHHECLNHLLAQNVTVHRARMLHRGGLAHPLTRQRLLLPPAA